MSISIIPQPSVLHQQDGVFILDRNTSIKYAPDAKPEADYLGEQIVSATGFNVPDSAPGASTGVIELSLVDLLPGGGNGVQPRSSAELAPEAYRLTVTSSSVRIEASARAGLFYGIQTILQLLPSMIFAVTGAHGAVWSIPCVQIEDQPRFGWRGAMLDVSRHFLTVSEVKKFIDLLAMHKLNTLHLHLTDDQGWRIEIKKYPRLTSIGAFRDETIIGHMEHYYGREGEHKYNSAPHGGFYTQEEARDIVAYAASRHINVVPEIELPGHAQAAIAAYPELGNQATPVGVCRHWGIIEHIFNARESTILFLQDVIAEVLEIFPSPFIHIGGDEAVKTEWEASEEIQARIKELGLHDEHELQSYYIRRMDDFLVSRGRRLVGWDEILEGGLAKNATVMSWRGEAGGITAAEAGHDVVMAPGTYTYLDHYQSKDRSSEPIAQGGFLPLSVVYHYNPVPAEMSDQAATHVLGAQAQLWSEYLPTVRDVQYMAFPRLSALAEAVWRPASTPLDYEAFLDRLSEHLKRLDLLGVRYRPVTERP